MIQFVPSSQKPDIVPVQIHTDPLLGQFQVGVCHYLAVDPARWDEQDDVPRQFMVSAFFPAESNLQATAARLVDLFEPTVDQALAYITEGLDDKTKDALISKLRTIGLRSIRDARPQTSKGPYPALIYYAAGGCNRFGNVDVCEALASHGYVVLAVDAPHDAPLVVFPDGHLCKGPFEGDYISPGVGDVGYLIEQLDDLNRNGFLGGMIDTDRVGVFGHSRGGYIANITAFLHERVKAAASIDCFLWGYASEGTGLERHPAGFQATVRRTSKPILRMCGRPAGANATEEAEFCLHRDGGEFIGDFSVVAFPGWSHRDFITTPWLCGKGQSLVECQAEPRTDAAATLGELLTAFFNIHLLGAPEGELSQFVRHYPALGTAVRLAAR